MRAAAGRAAAKVEQPELLVRGALEKTPVKQHVRRDALMLLQRRRPRHLELSVPSQAAAARDGGSIEVRASEPNVVTKGVGDRLEEGERLGGRAEVAHVT